MNDEYNSLGAKCNAAGCLKKSTHKLTTKVLDSSIGEFEQEVWYCLEDALYFASWLPYCYAGKHEFVSIEPTFAEYRKTLWHGKD